MLGHGCLNGRGRACRINSGCVPRLQLEAWLAKECAALMRQVAASTVLELLSVNTYGKTGRHVLYKPFLDGLEAAIGNVSPVGHRVRCSNTAAKQYIQDGKRQPTAPLT